MDGWKYFYDWNGYYIIGGEYLFGRFENFKWEYSSGLIRITGDNKKALISLAEYYLLYDDTYEFTILINGKIGKLSGINAYDDIQLRYNSEKNVFEGDVPYPIFTNKDECYYLSKEKW